MQVHAEVPQGYPKDETNHRGKQPRCDVHDRTLCLRLRSNCQTRLVGQVQEVGEPDQCILSGLTVFYSAGPIVEQGTHFCDLSRYFGGEVDISSVTAHSLEWDENAGQLSKMAIDESKIAPENRIPRVTSATWYDSSNLRTP